MVDRRSKVSMSYISIMLMVYSSTAASLSLFRRKGEKCHRIDSLSVFAQFIVAPSR